MTDREALSEELLDGWLSMSTTIWNERLVSAMTYNESMVCNLLYKQHCAGGTPLTATELGTRLQIRKPQMNVILNGLEKRGIIARVRSQEDRRNVNVFLTGAGVPFYEKAHREILQLPAAVIDRIGEERTKAFAETMKEVADCFREIVGGTLS